MTHAKLKVETLPLIRLRPHPKNPRLHPEPGSERWNALKKSLCDSYWDPLIWNRKNGMLVSGHLRAKVLDEMGCKKADTVVVNFTEKQHVRVMLRANRNDGDWENDQLTALLKEMQDDERLLAGFDLDGLKELDIQLNGEKAMEDAEPQIDRAKELQKKWKTELGQIWKVGEHELFCGDFRNDEMVKKVEMIFSDPPYGHNNNDGDLIQNWESALGVPKTKASAPRPIDNDSPEEAAKVFKAFCEMSRDSLVPGACCCCCCGGGGGPDPQFARWALELDNHLPFKHAVVWDKGGLGMGWHYRRNYEFVLIAQKPGAACHWFGGNDVPNVIRDIGKIIPQADQHPTEKPIELPSWFIKLHSQKGDTVYDPFLGSGTTMVACQNLERKCIGVEIAPEYVAVALQRMEDAFGITGELVK